MKTTEHKTLQKVSVLTLVGIVVGSIVGGGVFTLRRSFGSATGVLGAIIAWIIAGTGMLMLAFVFQSLALRRPDLDSGVYIYAKTGFGNYACRAGLGLRVALPLLDRQGSPPGSGRQPDRHDREARPHSRVHHRCRLRLRPQTFAANFWGGETRSVRSLFDQVTDTMLVTTLCSSESREPACTPGSRGAARTSDAPPCWASSAC